jgi:hypothetical protein
LATSLKLALQQSAINSAKSTTMAVENGFVE